MAIVGQLVVLMSTNNAQLTAGLAAAEAQMRGFALTANQIIGGVAATVAVVATAALGGAVMAAASFQEQMAIVNTVAKLTPEALAGIGKEVRQLSVATGEGLPGLTQGLYDIVSAGVPAANAMDILRQSTTLAIGGISSVPEAVNVITTGVNAWSVAQGNANLTVADSARVMDVFAKAIEGGKLTASDIAGSIANVASTAAAMNIPIEEIGATYAVLTSKGVPAAEATTRLNAALIALQRVPPGMQTLQDATGKSYEQMARTQGAQAAMQALVTDATKYGVQLIDVFGRQEAMAFALDVTGAAAPGYQAALTNMYDATGTGASQAAERMGTAERQMAILGRSVGGLAISLGTPLLPNLTALETKLSEIVISVTAWAEANPGLASTILPVTIGVGLLTVGVLALNVVVGALAVLLSPVGLFFAAVIVIIALVVTNMDNLKRGIQFVIDKWNELMSLAPFKQSEAVADFSEEFQKKHGRRPTHVELEQAGLGFNPTAPGDRTNPVIDSIRTSPVIRTNPLIEGIRNGFQSGMPGVSGYAHGGMVPGIGPQLAILHGGETVTPAGRAAFGGGQAVPSGGFSGGGTLILQVDGHEMYRITDERLAVREGLVTVLRPGTA